MYKAHIAESKEPRIVRDATLKERAIRALQYASTFLGLLLLAAWENSWQWSFAMDLISVLGVILGTYGARPFKIKVFSPESQAVIAEARREDIREYKEWCTAALRSWYGRLAAAAAILWLCYWYFNARASLTWQEDVILGCAIIFALVWAWQTSLLVLGLALVIWLLHLPWHITTPVAVIIGAIIVASAIREKNS